MDALYPLPPINPPTEADDDLPPTRTVRQRLAGTHRLKALTVTSHLSSSEPVSEAEIRLVLASMGDKIVALLRGEA